MNAVSHVVYCAPAFGCIGKAAEVPPTQDAPFISTQTGTALTLVGQNGFSQKVVTIFARNHLNFLVSPSGFEPLLTA